jgi:hypothetical protein
MKYVQVLIMMLVFENILDSVVVMPASCMHYQARRLAYHQKLIRLVYYFDGKVEHWRLHSHRYVNYSISISKDIVRSNLLVIHPNLTNFDSIFVIFRGIGLKLLD